MTSTRAFNLIKLLNGATKRGISAKTSVSPILDKSNVTHQLEFIDPTASAELVASYRVLNKDGSLAAPIDPSLSNDKIVQLYTDMLTLNSMDKVMFDSHRQGRISFYMTSFGEEATQMGSAGALEPDDWIYAQYREAGALLHRQMPLKQLLAQCYGNKEDLGKGRQMPIHYGSRALNYVTVSSPLATQMPQAAGTAYSFKVNNQSKCVICYFGEGAASEGDAHAAMNFAATLECPVIFFCRNNGYAISTPASEQFKSDGVIMRGLGYGMAAIRVDGNDLFAVYAATRAARQLCIEQSRPVLIESMTYRVGHHSTSDDSSAYRSSEEVDAWVQHDNPVERVSHYLKANNLWSEEQDDAFRSDARRRVIEALNWAENIKKLPIGSMFEDVYAPDDMPKNIERQRDELRQHLERFGNEYPLKEYESL